MKIEGIRKDKKMFVHFMAREKKLGRGGLWIVRKKMSIALELLRMAQHNTHKKSHQITELGNNK